MSKNLADYQRDNIPRTAITSLVREQGQQRSLQKQGAQATRLGVIDGYFEMTFTLDDLNFERAAFAEFVAPEDATIVVGSLVYSTYMARISYSNPTGPVSVYSLDVSNAGWGGVSWNTWLPYSLQTDDPDYSTAFYLSEIPDSRLPHNRIRVGTKSYLKQGMGTLDTLKIIVVYQLRITVGWAAN